MRKELNRENPSRYVCREGTETTVIHEDITQWGVQKEMVDTFCLRGWLYMERSDTPTSAWGDLLGRSVSPISRRQQSTDIWQKMQPEHLNAMIMRICIMHDECWQTDMSNTHRSRNQPPGTTLPEGKPKDHPRAKEICRRLGYQGTTPSCMGGRPQEAAGGIVSHNRRKEFIAQADTTTTATHAGGQRYQEATKSLVGIDRHR